VIVKLASASALRALLANDGLKPERKQQDTSIRKQQEPREPGSMDTSNRPSTRPASLSATSRLLVASSALTVTSSAQIGFGFLVEFFVKTIN
jgi:hypothetical protein